MNGNAFNFYKSVIQACRWDAKSAPPSYEAMFPACLHECGPAGAHLKVGAIWTRRLSDGIIWELPCSEQHWAHEGPDKRHPWQLVGHVFSLSPAGPESSVAVSQPEESGCVNRIKRDTVDLCICFGLRFCVMKESGPAQPDGQRFIKPSDALVYYGV